jgi:hypothetical protein
LKEYGPARTYIFILTLAHFQVIRIGREQQYLPQKHSIFHVLQLHGQSLMLQQLEGRSLERKGIIILGVGNHIADKFCLPK